MKSSFLQQAEALIGSLGACPWSSYKKWQAWGPIALETDPSPVSPGGALDEHGRHMSLLMVPSTECSPSTTTGLSSAFAATPCSRRRFVGLATGSIVVAAHAKPGLLARKDPRTPTGYFFDSSMLNYTHPPPHPETPQRLRTAHARVVRSDLFDRLKGISPKAEVLSYIRAVHSSRHVDAVMRLGTPAEAATTAIRGALGAIDAVCRGEIANAFCAVRPPGHHAHNQRRQYGYCY